MSVVKLTNGGTIQIRTGVLAGVGPTGPRGSVGPQGPQGDVGPEGQQGPIGQILEQYSSATVTSGTSLLAATQTNVAFQTVSFDDLSCFVSTTNIQLRNTTDYLINAWVEFGPPSGTASGIRHLQIASTTNGTLGRVQVPTVVGDSTYLQVSTVWRCTVADEIINIKAYSTNACSVSNGRVTVNRVGSGPRGIQGPQGPTGLQGATGAQGPKGDDGNATSGFGTYADLL